MSAIARPVYQPELWSKPTASNSLFEIRFHSALISSGGLRGGGQGHLVDRSSTRQRLNSFGLVQLGTWNSVLQFRSWLVVLSSTRRRQSANYVSWLTPPVTQGPCPAHVTSPVSHPSATYTSGSCDFFATHWLLIRRSSVRWSTVDWIIVTYPGQSAAQLFAVHDAFFCSSRPAAYAVGQCVQADAWPSSLAASAATHQTVHGGTQVYRRTRTRLHIPDVFLVLHHYRRMLHFVLLHPVVYWSRISGCRLSSGVVYAQSMASASSKRSKQNEHTSASPYHDGIGCVYIA